MSRGLSRKDLLKKDILISVTSFFRDSEAFDRLLKIFGDTFAHRAQDEAIRIWVPGCSTGEEVYSIAILLAEILEGKFDKYHVQIFATDVDDDSIEIVRKGVYPAVSIKNVEQRPLEKYFTQAG